MGCFFGVFFLFASFGMFALVWQVLVAIGVEGLPTGFIPLHTLGLPALVVSLLRVAGLLLALLCLAGIFYALRAWRRMARPVGDMIEVVGRVADGDYSARVTAHGPREVHALAAAINGMSERLQSSAELRRVMLAEVTHELRTPLTIIQGNLEGLLDGVYPADEEHLKSILEETHVLARIIEDLRTLALVEGAGLKLQREASDPAGLVDAAAAAFEAQARSAGVTLAQDSAPGLPEVDVDPARIHEVLTNLLANALRYTPAGGRITLRAWSEPGQAEWVSLSVSDTGTGIAPEDLAHIFERFYKSSDSHGSGLGLAIARGLVSAHGGEIKATSQTGQGTTITFTLPAASP
jgi:two-component system OmpR family sensor kinase/two-component system sensor histidine kinase BaeS